MSFRYILRDDDFAAVTEYSKLVKASKATIHIERRAMEAVIRYLLRYAAEPHRITIRGVARGLRLSYSKVRRLLEKLEKTRVIERRPAGKSIVYEVVNLDLATRKEYIKLTSDELEFLSILSAWPGSELLKAIPKVSSLATSYKKGLSKLADAWTNALAAYSIVAPDRIDYRPPEPPSREVMRLAKRFEKWGEPSISVGELPLVSLPVIRTLLVPVEERLSDLTKEELRAEERPIVLKYAPQTYGILLRELFFELDCKEDPTEAEVKEALRTIAEKQLRLLLHVDAPLIKSIQRGRLPKMVTKEALAYESIVLRFASMFALNLGGDEELVFRAKEAADLLQKEAERRWKKS